jgi:hypothetical protein
MRRVAVLLLFFVPVVGRASPAEVFGLGSRASGAGGAAAAWIDDFSAGHYNPAGIAFAGRKTLTAGVLASMSRLEVNDRAAEIPQPVGVVLGAAGPLPLGGALEGRLHVGMGLVVLPRTILRITARLPDEPFFPYYDNRAQRLVVLPFLAARITDDLAVGVAVNVLAGVQGNVLAFQGPTRALEPRVDEEIPPRARVNAGARWRFARDHNLALVFRQSFSVPFATVADTEVAGEPLALDLRADGLYTPDELILGYALRTDAVAVGLDLTWARWSGYGGPFVRVGSDLPLVGSLVGSAPEVPFEDSLGARAGVEWRLSRTFLRAGWGFETSPVPARQSGVTNLLDGDKHTLSTGIGVRLGAVRVDLHAQAQIVSARTLEKRLAGAGEEPAAFEALRDEVIDNPNQPDTLGAQISNPGYPFIDGGGVMLSGGLTVELEL